jgi:hypothetical protein
MVRLGRLTALCIETDLKTSAYFAFRLLVMGLGLHDLVTPLPE